MKNALTPTASVYSSIAGIVTKSSTSGKYVSIYNSDLGITMNFQHLNNIDGTGVLLEGQRVVHLQKLGNQNTTNGHIHIQVCNDGSVDNQSGKCTTIHSGSNLDLVCIKPYQYIK